MPEYKRFCEWLSWKQGYIGREASSRDYGQRLQSIISYLMHWHQHSSLFNYTGPPNPEFNGGVESGSYPGHYEWDNDIYVIWKSPDKTDTTNPDRPLMLSLTPWKTERFTGDTQLGNNPALTWAPDYTAPGTAETIWGGNTLYDNDGNADYGDECKEPLIQVYDETNFCATPNSGGYDCGILTVDQIMIASLLICYAPEGVYTDAQAQNKPADLAAGKTIRGYTADDMRSLGGLMHNMGDGTETMEGVESIGARCLFQWGHPMNLFCNAAQSNLFNEKIWLPYTRNLTGASSGTQNVYPCMVLKGGDADCTVTWTAATSTDTWVYDFSGAVGSYTLIEPTDGTTNDLDIDNNAADFLTISVANPNAAEIRFKTFALFEATNI